MDDTKFSLYKLAKQQAALQNEYERVQQLLRMQSKMELLNTINRVSEIIDNITTVTFSENVLENQENDNKYLEIESKNASNLQNLKERIFEIFAAQEGIGDVEFPDDLENHLQETKIEIRKQKEQIKEYFRLVQNCDAIFKDSNLEMSVSDGSDYLI